MKPLLPWKNFQTFRAADMPMWQLGWLVGLIEGEGSFQFHVRMKVPVLTANMTDRDVIVQAAKLMGAVVYGPYKTKHKPNWRFVLEGIRAARWMVTLAPLLKSRRRKQISVALSCWLKTDKVWRLRRDSLTDII